MRRHVRVVASQCRLSDKFERPHAREQDSSQRHARSEKEARSRVFKNAHFDDFKMLILKTRVQVSLSGFACRRGQATKRTTDSVFGLSVACFHTDSSFFGLQGFPGRPPTALSWPPAECPFFWSTSRTHTPWFDCSPIVLMLLRVDGRVRPALIFAACLHAGTPGIRNERLPAACVADTAAVCTAIVQPTRQVGVRRVLPAKVHTRTILRTRMWTRGNAAESKTGRRFVSCSHNAIHV